MTDDARAAFTEAVETGYWPELPESEAPRAVFTNEPGAIIRLPVGDLNDVMKAYFLSTVDGQAPLVVNRYRDAVAFHPPVKPWLDLDNPVVRAVLAVAALAFGYLVL